MPLFPRFLDADRRGALDEAALEVQSAGRRELQALRGSRATLPPPLLEPPPQPPLLLPLPCAPRCPHVNPDSCPHVNSDSCPSESAYKLITCVCRRPAAYTVHGLPVHPAGVTHNIYFMGL